MLTKFFLIAKNPNFIPLPYYIFPFILIIIGYCLEYNAESRNGLLNNQPPEWNEVLNSLRQSKNQNMGFDSSAAYLTSGFMIHLPGCMVDIGKQQKFSWANKMFEALQDSVKSVTRLDILRNELINKENPSFLSVREKYEQEKSFFGTQTEKIKKIRIKTGSQYLFILAEIYVSILFICIFCSIILNVMSVNNIKLLSGLSDWKKTYFFLVFILFLANTSLSILTSILETDKQWIIPASFFVCWEAWFWERLSVLGINMINAIPLTQLWCYAKRKYIPKISLTKLGGYAGKLAVEKYILFLQICTISIFIVLSLITVILLKWSSSQQNDFDSEYLILIILLFMLLMLFVGKLIRNAVLIRFKYQQALSIQFKTFEELQKAKILPDPTIDFIGESWWKLPVNFVSIMTAIWAVFNLTGIANLILNAIK